MVERALEAALDGRAVYLLLERGTHSVWRTYIEDVWFLRTGAQQGHGIKLETPESLGYAFDWRTLRIRHAHPNTLVLVDHYFCEKQIMEHQRRIAELQAAITQLHPLTF
jgi:hypothetical protein